MNTLSVDGAEIVKAYESSKEDFKQVKVKVIYVSFVSEALLKSGAAKGLNETQAKAKAEKLVREIRGGADFVKLVKANSDDADSRDKDGDFTTMRRTDKLPEAIRTAVFALKRGEISDPVRQPNGFYIFKADDVIFSPLSEVRDEIYNQVKMKMHEKWVADTVANTKVDLVSNDFFKPSAPAAKPAAPPAK
jgi:parvulin-like peptidyl-prolyl isomerase